MKSARCCQVHERNERMGNKKVLEHKKSLVVFPDYITDLDQMPSLERK